MFDFVLWISAFFLALITVLMILFVIRYRHREGEDAKGARTHNTALEITWSVIPLILVILIFWYGFEVYLDMATPPEDSYEVLVTGQKWKWLFPNRHRFLRWKLPPRNWLKKQKKKKPQRKKSCV